MIIRDSYDMEDNSVKTISTDTVNDEQLLDSLIAYFKLNRDPTELMSVLDMLSQDDESSSKDDLYIGKYKSPEKQKEALKTPLNASKPFSIEEIELGDWDFSDPDSPRSGVIIAPDFSGNSNIITNILESPELLRKFILETYDDKHP